MEPIRGTTPRRVVIAGASGFVGSALVAAYRADGADVRTIGRAHHRTPAAPIPDATWDDPASIGRLVDGADLVINLAGKSVNCRYTDRNRDEILRSRVATTRALREAIAAASRPPRVWMNASTATIYRHATDHPQSDHPQTDHPQTDHPQTDRTGAATPGELGTGFSVDVARSWERELFAGDLPGTRRVALRMAIVLGDGPATGMLLRLARLGLGGPQYDGWWPQHRRYRGIGDHPTGDGRAPRHRTRGRQRFSWIHLDDVVGAVRFLDMYDEIAGPVNVASPRPSDNRTLMGILRRAVRAPIGLPAFRWMLEPAMWALRTEPELVLKSRWVTPERLTDAGFEFACPDLAQAVEAIVAERPVSEQAASLTR